MTTLRPATDIRIIWDDSPSANGWYVRYTDGDQTGLDEAMGMSDDPDGDISELYAQTKAALAYAGCRIACGEIEICDCGVSNTVQVADLED